MMINLDKVFSLDRKVEDLNEILEEKLYPMITHGEALGEKIKFKIKGKQQTVKLNKAIFALILILVRFPLKRELVAEDLGLDVDPAKINSFLIKYYDTTLREVLGDVETSKKVKEAIGDVACRMADLTWTLNVQLGNSINVYDIVHLMKVNQEVADIINYKTSNDDQYAEMEAGITKANNRLIEIFRSPEVKTCYRGIIGSTNKNQFSEVFTNIGLKPDLFGRIIPEPINTSFLRGMRNSDDFFINATGARKALTTNAIQVGMAGYLTRKLCLLLIRTTMDRSVDDCGAEPIGVFIKDSATLERYDNRHLVEGDDTMKYRIIDASKDTSLIGTTIRVRSPIMCEAGAYEDNHICPACYGANASLVDMHIGLVAAIYLTEQFTQKLLSTKHLLKANVDTIELPDGMDAYFKVARSSLIANDNFKFSFIMEAVDAEEEFEETSRIQTVIVHDEEDREFDVSELNLSLSDTYGDKILSNTLEAQYDGEVFKFAVMNNEISAPLKKLIRLLENQGELDKLSGPSEFLEKALELLTGAEIQISGVNLELIARCLSRNPDDLTERFHTLDEVKMLRLPGAILNSSSLSVAISYEQL